MSLSAWYILPAAFLLDLIIGDPHFKHHPVRYMGKAIESAEKRFRKLPLPPVISGGLMAVLLITSVWAVTTLLIFSVQCFHPFIAALIEIIIAYFCISCRGLESAAMTVYTRLKNKGPESARQALAMIVGREVDGLSERGVSRAAVETVAENLVDGVISPLFFAAIWGVPLMMAYKMVNTLDSMIGYKNDRYRDFGKIAAHIDDAANYLPARLSVPVLALAAQLLNGRGRLAFNTAKKEGRNHTSPNAGLSEAAVAGALGIKLGGPNRYHGKMVEKPYIGKGFGKTGPEHIRKACDLMITASFLWLLAAWGGSMMLCFV